MSAETRCKYCLITFATSSELSNHAEHYCFPDEPARVLQLFPPGSEVLDTVSKATGVVVGAASNPKMSHSSVSFQHDKNGVIADVAISRLAALPNKSDVR